MLIDPSKERQPKKQKKAITDWELCIICQEATTEHTVCPAKSADPGIGYKTLAEDMELFQRNGCLPVHIDFSRFDEGSGPAVTMTDHKARWHKSCRVRLNKAKFKRAKRLSDQDKSTLVASSTSGNRVSERVVKYQSEDTACFFCDLPAKGKLNLHEASTIEIDAQVRRFATDLHAAPCKTGWRRYDCLGGKIS